MNILCECNSFEGCRQVIDLSVETQLEIRKIQNVVIIVDGCPNGPEPTDTLIEERSGYSIYEEKV